MSLDTTWTAFGQPSPRARPLSYTEHAWRIVGARALPSPGPMDPWSAVIAARESRRTFGPLPLGALAELLWYVCACKRSMDSAMGFAIEKRGVPSAGGIHPIHVLIADPQTRVLERYDGRSHALERLATSAPQELLTACAELLAPQEGALLLFAAEPGKTTAKYENGDSLVWRDAGVQQGAFAMVAEALGLNFCLLGMSGEPWVSSLSEEGKLRGVGMALVGSRP